MGLIESMSNFVGGGKRRRRRSRKGMRGGLNSEAADRDNAIDANALKKALAADLALAEAAENGCEGAGATWDSANRQVYVGCRRHQYGQNRSWRRSSPLAQRQTWNKEKDPQNKEKGRSFKTVCSTRTFSVSLSCRTYKTKTVAT